MNLPKPGPNVYNRINVKNARGLLMCGAAVIIGKGRNARSHIHSTTGVSIATPETPDKIDPVKLARELEVDMVAVNRGRIWTFDEGDYQGGYIIDFHGVKMTWVGEMVAEDLFQQFENAYLPSLIYRVTNWIYYAGKPVYLLREPGGGGAGLGHAGDDEGCRPEPRHQQPSRSGQQAEEPAARLEV